METGNQKYQGLGEKRIAGRWIFIFGLVLALCVSLQAAETYSFYGFNTNDPQNITVGQTQLFVDVSAVGTDQVLFNFYNTGPESCYVTGIHFDNPDGLLASLSAINNEPGVCFIPGMHPSGLPGGSSLVPEFISDPDLATKAKNPAPHNGLGTSESLGLLFALDQNDFAGIIGALDEGTLRIGLQVQGFPYGDGEDSAQFVTNGPPPMIPAPSAILLTGVGTFVVGWLRRRKEL